MLFYSHLHFIRVGGVIASFREMLFALRDGQTHKFNNGLQTGRSVERNVQWLNVSALTHSRCSSSLPVRIRNLSATMRKSPPIGTHVSFRNSGCVRANVRRDLLGFRY